LTLPLIKTEKLTHIYSTGTPFERVAVNDVDFEVEKGEYLAIIGQTGSGKSTFIQHLNGLLKPTSGHVYFDGRDILESKEYTRQIRFKVGIVYQYPEYQLFESTLYDDIAFGPRNMGLSESQVHDRVIESVGFAQLDKSLLEKSPFELSGGLKRRAAIAGVIAMHPQVLILDEPTAGLDPRGRAEIINNINEYKQAHNATVIMVTHSMEEVARNADRIVIFEKGGIVMNGTPADVFSRSEQLIKMDLSAPQAALVAQRLIAMGLQIDSRIFTIAQLKSALLTYRARRS
jgi:energy-coupling factor transport system ATP-binding protein